jgi:hypothetical protein
LDADGASLRRGPRLRIPEVAGTDVVTVSAVDRDIWADKGWVDLRPANFARWQRRFAAMHAAGPPVAGQVVRASSAMDCQYSNSVSQRSQR